MRQLAERGLVDPARVGHHRLVLRGLRHADGAVPRAATCSGSASPGAPVTHWDGYDTHYTERYMGLPSENAARVRARRACCRGVGARGKLMIVHGMIDENVHFRHTGRLVNALMAARKEFDLRVFPDERHMPRKPADRLYMEQQIVRFLVEGL